ncbi:hypothetical protein JD844_017583 [Phrynosoma platyrhinos]|uniref:Phosphatidic acid phosphatase type 2/haloperoxidase domain-containing protein n=1 Tax=Phrynosoma platyrhinos TaxID=52577 RepID=A0ABQ7SM86_PHRPL|nr:hypothetical protein JD844_017583 [Phrynosoma platyrhinos]
MYITNTIKSRGTRLAKPVLCLSLMCLAFLTGINRVAEYRNHWSDVIAGFLVGISIAVFLVVCVVNNFRGRQPENEHSHMDNLAQMPMISIPRVESPLEKQLLDEIKRLHLELRNEIRESKEETRKEIRESREGTKKEKHAKGRYRNSNNEVEKKHKKNTMESLENLDNAKEDSGKGKELEKSITEDDDEETFDRDEESKDDLARGGGTDSLEEEEVGIE